MTADGLRTAVRRQLGLGRLVPLGEREDGAWIAERAAVRVLRGAVLGVPGVRVDDLRLALADAGDTGKRREAGNAVARPAVPLPPGALPPGPLRVEAVCAADPGRPLPESVGTVRAVLAAAARERLGLAVVAVDVHVAELLEGPVRVSGDEDDEAEQEAAPQAAQEAAQEAALEAQAEASPGSPPGEDPDEAAGAAGAGAGAAGAVAAAVLAVPGAREVSTALGGRGRAVEVVDGGTPPGRLVRLQLAVGGERRTLDVVRQAGPAAARAAAAGAPGPVTVSVVVTAVVT